MTLYKWLIEPSPKIAGSTARLRAELASAVTLVRQVVVVGFLIWAAAAGEPHHPAVVFTFATNLFVYALSRTRFSNFAIAFLFIELLAGIVVGSQSPMSDVSALIMWLSIGPLMAFIILPLHLALLNVVATLIVAYFCTNHSVSATSLGTSSPVLFMCECIALGFVSAFFKLRAEKTLAIERAKVLQSSKLASLGEMASGVAHELNSPLGAIVMNSELLKEILSSDEEVSRKDLHSSIDEIINVAERMSVIISGLKSFARESHNEPLTLVPVQAWIDDALNLCSQKFKANGVQIHVSGDALSSASSVRRVQLSQVLINLLSNSFDAIRSQKNAWITIEAKVNDGLLVVSVTDSGTGITQKVRDRLFEPFHTTKDFGEGTGLGLSVSRGIMNAHGGSLLYDETCANTRFLMKIPFEKLGESASQQETAA